MGGDASATVGMQESRTAIIQAAVDAARRDLDIEAVFAAPRDADGQYRITIENGLLHESTLGLLILPGLGVGGIAMSTGRPRLVIDYQRDRSISSDYFSVVVREGLHGMVAVPVCSPAGIEFLFYAGMRHAGSIGELAIKRMADLGKSAAIGLHHVDEHERQEELALVRERQRMATRLHDSVAQSLFAIGVEAKRSRSITDPEVLASCLQEIERTAAAARQELRETLARLSACPAALSFEALFAAEVKLFERTSGRPVVVARRGEPTPLVDHQEELVLDALREGLRNILKHGGRGTTLVHLGFLGDRLVLSMQCEELDQLRSILARCEVPGIQEGSGLGMLRARARQARGNLELFFDDQGTAIFRLELPIAEELEPAP